MTCLNVFGGTGIDPQKLSQHYSALFFSFSVPTPVKVLFLTRFSMERHLSLYDGMDRRYFLCHTMSVMIWQKICKQKFDELS
jgi:hypothetical protein